MKEAIAHWNEETIERQLQQKGIKWVFQPHAAPHLSGVWEHLVQITKKQLKRAAGDGLLSDVELGPLLITVLPLLFQMILMTAQCSRPTMTAQCLCPTTSCCKELLNFHPVYL